MMFISMPVFHVSSEPIAYNGKVTLFVQHVVHACACARICYTLRLPLSVHSGALLSPPKQQFKQRLNEPRFFSSCVQPENLGLRTTFQFLLSGRSAMCVYSIKCATHKVMQIGVRSKPSSSTTVAD